MLGNVCIVLTFDLLFADFFSSHPPCYLWRELGGWPASPPQFPLQRVREAPWGPPRCGLPCEGFPGWAFPVRASRWGIPPWGLTPQDPTGRGPDLSGTRH